MTRLEKSVFISYRRADRYTAVLVFKDLTQHGYDAFIDYDGIASGTSRARSSTTFAPGPISSFY